MALSGGRDHKYAALRSLRALGIRQLARPYHGTSRSVFCLGVDGANEFVLVQCRSYQADTDRYLVGLMVEALASVRSVVLYFDGESKFFKIPARFLREIRDERERVGDARYTGKESEQWRVDIFVHQEELSPQGSGGARYSLRPYAIHPAQREQACEKLRRSFLEPRPPRELWITKAALKERLFGSWVTELEVTQQVRATDAIIKILGLNSRGAFTRDQFAVLQETLTPYKRLARLEAIVRQAEG